MMQSRSDKESCLRDLAIVLPSLDPDDKFDAVVSGLAEQGFAHVIIVDDGSAADKQVHFEKAAAFPCCVVLRHEGNKGKGRALKTAFSHVLEKLPAVKGVITIDGDGQHLLKDILACGERMLQEKDKIVPRSVAGNKTTSRMFRLVYGIRISDTQTGLRAIPRAFLETLVQMEGERFEYETNMLLKMKKLGIGFVEQPITTVYDPEDYSSHYNAVKDSWRIFKIMVKGLFV